MRLHFIRHGQTVANEKRLYCGHTDISLSENGKNQLLELQNTIRYPQGDFYITSGRKRCKETLELLYRKEEDLCMKEWREMNFGLFEMKSYEELKDTKSYKEWLEDIERNVCPNGESHTIFLDRIQEGFIRLEELCQKRKYKDIVVITHGGVIANVMENLFQEEKNFYEWQPSCGRGYSIEVEKDRKNYQRI